MHNKVVTTWARFLSSPLDCSHNENHVLPFYRISKNGELGHAGYRFANSSDS